MPIGCEDVLLVIAGMMDISRKKPESSRAGTGSRRVNETSLLCTERPVRCSVVALGR
ncbi:hypothetical protein IE981_14715 [Klebsiella pneumoniae]|nr:hypothetical protein [Klebsiella pneumoniae]